MKKLIILISLILIGFVGFSQDYPQVHFTTEGDTLWTLTHEQYTNCLENTIDLYKAEQIILAKDTLIREYKLQYNLLAIDYNKEALWKQRWRTATISVSLVAILTSILAFK